jgi:hypothetical protein
VALDSESEPAMSSWSKSKPAMPGVAIVPPAKLLFTFQISVPPEAQVSEPVSSVAVADVVPVEIVLPL